MSITRSEWAPFCADLALAFRESIVASQQMTTRSPVSSKKRSAVAAETSNANDEEEESDASSSDCALDSTMIRSVSIQILPNNVHVQPPEIEHKVRASWTVYLEYLLDYADKMNLVIRVQEVMSYKERNKRLSRTKDAQSGEAVPLVPEE